MAMKTKSKKHTEHKRKGSGTPGSTPCPHREHSTVPTATIQGQWGKPVMDTEQNSSVLVGRHTITYAQTTQFTPKGSVLNKRGFSTQHLCM